MKLKMGMHIMGSYKFQGAIFLIIEWNQAFGDH